MKIIFLDIDGVLNNAAWAMAPDPHTGDPIGYGGWSNVIIKDTIKWDWRNVAALKKILDAVPDVAVVISSTWRNSYSVGEFNDMFDLYGLPRCVVDTTEPGDRKVRGLEVNDWLKKYNYVLAHVIIDDIADQFRRNQPVVITDPLYGLTEKDAEKAITILTGVPAKS